MHVTYGLNPRHVDDDVRFRTSYYFRTFDYCWDADVKVGQLIGQNGLPPKEPKPVDYRQIIPQTDTLYRYRMTGMASAAFSRIRFESGTLKKEQIDPFGAQVTYSREADGFYVRDSSEVKADAEKAKIAGALLARIDAMTKRRNEMPPGGERDKLSAAIDEATKTYLSGNAITPADLARIEQSIAEMSAELAKTKLAIAQLNVARTPGAAPDERIAALEAKAESQSVEIAKLSATKALATQGNELSPCPIGAKIRKGFQIMGPEGIRTFDQDERLVMAMSSSADPLIQTLQEYSGRLLGNKADTSSQLIGLAQENARAEAARRAISDARLGKAKASDLVNSALTSLQVDKAK